MHKKLFVSACCHEVEQLNIFVYNIYIYMCVCVRACVCMCVCVYVYFHLYIFLAIFLQSRLEKKKLFIDLSYNI